MSKYFWLRTRLRVKNETEKYALKTGSTFKTASQY